MYVSIWTTRLASDTAAVVSDSVFFELDSAAPHVMVLVYPVDEVSGNKLLYDVARHNFSTFVVSDFDLEPMNFGRLGLLVVKGFANFDEIVRYRRILEDDPELQLPAQVRPVMISVDDLKEFFYRQQYLVGIDRLYKIIGYLVAYSLIHDILLLALGYEHDRYMRSYTFYSVKSLKT